MKNISIEFNIIITLTLSNNKLLSLIRILKVDLLKGE